MPRRVQMMRTLGWRKPPGVVVCRRPLRWGNPFYITEQRDRATCLALFRNALDRRWDPAVVAHLSPACREETHRTFVAWVGQFLNAAPRLYAQRELRGRDLGCSCKLTDDCHVDILIEAANL